MAALPPDIKDEARSHLTSLITSALTGMFDFSRREESAAPSRVEEFNGWKLWELIPSGSVPTHSWTPTWPDRERNDLTGRHGDIVIGRVLKIPHLSKNDKWVWALSPFDANRDQTDIPFSGWEIGAPSAMCRAERCYNLLRKKSAGSGEDDQ